MAIARMIVRSGLLQRSVQRVLFAALMDYILNQTISLSDRDLSGCAVDLGRNPGAPPLRCDPPSLV